MDTKLTLKLDKNVIEKAKISATEHKHSLSFMIENYLKAVTSIEITEINEDFKISEIVKSISKWNGEIRPDLNIKKSDKIT